MGSGLVLGANLETAASILFRFSTSEQSPLCSDVFLCLRQKRRHPPAPLLLLSNCGPLRWARSWYAALRTAFPLISAPASFLSAHAKTLVRRTHANRQRAGWAALLKRCHKLEALVLTAPPTNAKKAMPSPTGSMVFLCDIHGVKRVSIRFNSAKKVPSWIACPHSPSQKRSCRT